LDLSEHGKLKVVYYLLLALTPTPGVDLYVTTEGLAKRLGMGLTPLPTILSH